jgi:hypothetical protein
MFGPPWIRDADGLEWRRVIVPSPTGNGGAQAGWVATADGTSMFLSMVNVACPAGPVDLATVIDMSEWARLTCFGSDELVLDGTVITGFGGY